MSHRVGKGTYVWNQGVARRAIMGGRAVTMNPTPAASFLIGKRVVARAKQVLRRKGKKRAFRGNPLPAVAGLLGGLPHLGRSQDPTKQRQRATAVNAVAAKAMTGDEKAVEQLTRIASGLEWPGQWADHRELATHHLQLVQEKLEKLHTAAAEKLAQQREVAAAGERRESRFLEAGTAIGGALAQGFGRSRRRPVRRRRPRRYY
jgi:hypothetical protein